jgi:hypothetical protein
MREHFKNIIARTYFWRLFKTDKLSFWVIFLFFFFTILSNLIRLQTTPFFIWGMYSEKIPPEKEYTMYEIYYNDGRLIKYDHTWNEPAKTMLNSPLKTYLNARANHSVSMEEIYFQSYWLKKHPAFTNMMESLYITRQELDEYPNWLKRYVSVQAGTPVGNVYVVAKRLQFEQSGGVRLIASDTVLYIK